MKQLTALDWIDFVLVIVGGLNWGLFAWFNMDLVATLLGTIPYAATAVYSLVALSALYLIYYLTK